MCMVFFILITMPYQDGRNNRINAHTERHLGSRRVDDDGESPGARDRHVVLLHRSTAALRATSPAMATSSARPDGGRGAPRYCTFACTTDGAFRRGPPALAQAPPGGQ